VDAKLWKKEKSVKKLKYPTKGLQQSFVTMNSTYGGKKICDMDYNHIVSCIGQVRYFINDRKKVQEKTGRFNQVLFGAPIFSWIERMFEQLKRVNDGYSYNDTQKLIEDAIKRNEEKYGSSD